MSLQKQISDYLATLPLSKRNDMESLQQMIVQIMPESKLWFLDGKDENGKVVSNPNIGFGSQTQTYANGKTREFYQIGISANTTGISLYIMGLEDKNYLPNTFATTIGKAKVTGYCIKFKALKDINLEVLEGAIRSGVELTGTL